MVSSRPTHEYGFTMIEMIIAMVLLSIAMGLVGSALVNALSGSSVSTSGAIADSEIAKVTARFQDDLAVAETDDRAANLVREQLVLDNALRNDADASSDDPNSSNTNVDLEDIVVATPTMVQFKAEVVRATPGAECVTWEAKTAGSAYMIVRTVGNAGCAGGTAEVVAKGRSDSSGIVLEPFSYDLRCHRTLCVGSGATSASTPCAAWNATSVTGRRDLRRIVAIRAKFTTNQGKNATDGHSGALMNIRSRQTHQWTTALGC